MYIVGITGGIGSGKTILSNIFKKKNIPVYNSDISAKKIMENIPDLKIKIINFFGQKCYINNKLNTIYLSHKIFNNYVNLKLINSIIYPYINQNFIDWMSLYKSPYYIKDTALLFESKTYKFCHLIITVISPINIRIKRLLKRNPNYTICKIIKIINLQWSDEKKKNYSNIIVKNYTTINKLEIIVEMIHNIIMSIL